MLGKRLLRRSDYDLAEKRGRRLKIVLIDPLRGHSHGIKSLAACLRLKGHAVEMIFLRFDFYNMPIIPGAVFRFSQSIVDEVLDKTRGADLVGITVMTNSFDMAVHLTNEIKERHKIPVVWGGSHPTVRPEECLEYADIVCIGEGEISMLNLAEKLSCGRDVYDIEGLWFNKNGEIIKNSQQPLIDNLDLLPVEDFTPRHAWVLHNKKLIRPDDLHYYSNDQYTVLTARGCYFSCTFCINSYLKKLYHDQKCFRKRSIEHFINELKEVINRHKNIKKIWFGDDTFLSRSNQELELFLGLYKRDIGLPFYCLAIPDKNINTEKLSILISAGLEKIQLGIQSTSRKVLDLFRRPCYKEDILAASMAIKEASENKIPIIYDLILDNPYETEEELISTLDFLMKLPRPYTINYFSLHFFPGLELSERAKKDGLISDEKRDIYRTTYIVRSANYISAMFFLMKFYGANKIPDFIMRLLIHRIMIKIFNNKLTSQLLQLLITVKDKRRYKRRMIEG
jgi:radical SAM superfamily enzyme YgiQ (UPF0313 family)